MSDIQVDFLERLIEGWIKSHSILLSDIKKTFPIVEDANFECGRVQGKIEMLEHMKNYMESVSVKNNAKDFLNSLKVSNEGH